MARNHKIQIRRDTAANWTSADPTLAAGELGLETDTGKVKAGDGATAWSSLDPINTGTYVAQVVYDGDVGASRPITGGVVMWVDFPSTPTNADADDIVVRSSAGDTLFDTNRRIAGDVAITSTSYVDVDNSLDLTLDVAAGDVVAFYLNGKWKGGEAAAGYLNIRSINLADEIEDATNGVPGWQGPPSEETPFGPPYFYTVQAGDVSSGQATFRLRARVNSGTRTLKGPFSDPLIFSAQVID